MTARPAPHPSAGFGDHLRRWRQARRVSQLDLALACGVSQRHLSFLESGRSRPSRGMALQLAAALNVPLRHQNQMLLSAGFSPVFGPRPLDAPELLPVNQALDHALSMQEPFPAIVVDRHYTLLRANRGALALLSFISGGAPPPTAPVNLVGSILSPDARAYIENWEEVAGWMVRRLRAEALLEELPGAPPPPFAELLEQPELERLASQVRDDRPLPPALSVRFRQGPVLLSLFSIIATLGTPLDAGLQDLRLELFYPTDDATRAWFQANTAAESP